MRFWLPKRVLFHYTSADFVIDARRELDRGSAAMFVVGSGSHYGDGLYATDLDPFGASRDEIDLACFHGSAGPRQLDGVLVLDPVGTVFEHVVDHIWRLPESPMAAIDLGPFLLGTGISRGESDWEMKEW